MPHGSDQRRLGGAAAARLLTASVEAHPFVWISAERGVTKLARRVTPRIPPTGKVAVRDCKDVEVCWDVLHA
eukprot:357859-Chlamydomonas_euryale.AAC.3